MPLTMRWRSSTRLPVEAPILRPDALSELSTAEVAMLRVQVGNTQKALGDLFDISGDGSDGVVRLEGDLRTVSRIGQRMTSGELHIDGDVGHHLGARMTGGLIELRGGAMSYCGAEMRGGRISISGNAGDNLGSAYPGSRLGMRGGVILVRGAAGADVGLSMRRGLIAVAGDVGATPGRSMIAGSVFAFAKVDIAPGLGMKRGSIVLLAPGQDIDSLIMPTFAESGTTRYPFVNIYLKQLASWGFPVGIATLNSTFARYNGDLASSGQGEILVRM